MTPEGVYRRLRRLFPAAWRDRHEAELLATLRDAAGPGRAQASPADVADLVRSAVVLRLRDLSGRLSVDRRRTAPWPAALALGAVAAAVGLAWATGTGSGGLSGEFLVTSLVVVVIPGTGVLYTVSSAVGGGWRRGVFAALGCTLGIVPHVMAAMLGLSGVMRAGAAAFEVVRWLGVAYLVAMGVSMFRTGGALRLDDPRPPAAAPGGVVARGIVVNLLNPKLTAFFFAFLPQFLDSPPGLLDPRLASLGAVFMVMTLAVFVAYAWASATVRERVLGAPAVLRWLQRSLGALVVGFAARLAVADR